MRNEPALWERLLKEMHQNRLVWLLYPLAISLSLSVCGIFLVSCDGVQGISGLSGNSGQDGADGADGAPGNDYVGGSLDVSDSTVLTQMIEDENRVVATIDDVTMSSGHPIVTFTLKDSNGKPLIGLASGKARFTIAKLQPAASDGLPATWRSYLNTTESSTTSADNAAGTPDAVAQALQATYESNGTLVDLGAGEYEYLFNKDLTNITSPVAVTWEPTLTHRIGLQISLNSSINPDNPTYTFVPDESAVTLEKDMADTTNCNNCHERLSLHGGGRFTVDFCVTCHNPYTRDEDSGNLLDMAAMVHGIHSANFRNQLESGHLDASLAADPLDSTALDYKIYGYQESSNDYSEVTYPQSELFCETCHTQSATRPQGDLWKTVVSAETCGGCHADGLVAQSANPTTGLAEYRFQHPYKAGGIGATAPQQNSTCNICHSGAVAGALWSERAIDPLNAHNQGAKKASNMAAEQFLFEVLQVTQTDVGEHPLIKFKVSNPLAATNYDVKDAADGSAFDYTGGVKATFNIYYSWSAGDINNKGSGNNGGTTPGYPVRIKIDKIQTAATTDNGDGTFTLDTGHAAAGALPAIPAGASNIVVGMDGHPLADVDESGVVGNSSADYVPAKSTVFNSGTARRTIVTAAKCDTCHKQITAHGSNRNDEPNQCVLCHNADATDVAGHSGDWTTPGPDGRGEQSIDFGFMIHGIHNANIYLATTDFSEVTYPGRISNCQACHEGNTFYKNTGDARPVTVGTGSDLADPDDDEAITATAAMCYACHDSTAAKAHMELNGAVIPDGDPNTNSSAGAAAGGGRPLKGDIGATPSSVESCDVCHASGRTSDIAVVHRLQ